MTGDHPANLVAGNRATAVVTQGEEPTVVSRDGYITTPAGDGYCSESVLPFTRCRDKHTHYAIVAGREEVLEAYTRALDELLRLCGPVCEHDGKRASEHGKVRWLCGWQDSHHEYIGRATFHDSPVCGADLAMGGKCLGDKSAYLHGPCSAHPSWPEGETWLREHTH